MTSDHHGGAPGTIVSVSCNSVYSFTKPVRDEIVLVAGIGVAGDVHAGVHVKHRGRVRADPTQPNLRQVHLLHRELFAEVGAKGYAVAPGDLGENVTTSGIDLLGLPLGTILRFGPPPRAGLTPGGGRAPEEGRGRAEGQARGEGQAPEEDQAGGEDRAAGASRARGEGERAPREGGPAADTAVAGVLAAAAGAVLDGPTAAAVRALAAAAGRDRGDDPRPAVVVAGLRNPCQQINAFRAGLLKEVIGQDEQGNVVRKGGVMAVVLRGGPVRPGQTVDVELPPGPYVPLERV